MVQNYSMNTLILLLLAEGQRSNTKTHDLPFEHSSKKNDAIIAVSAPNDEGQTALAKGLLLWHYMQDIYIRDLTFFILNFSLVSTGRATDMSTLPVNTFFGATKLKD